MEVGYLCTTAANLKSSFEMEFLLLQMHCAKLLETISHGRAFQLTDNAYLHSAPTLPIWSPLPPAERLVLPHTTAACCSTCVPSRLSWSQVRPLLQCVQIRSRVSPQGMLSSQKQANTQPPALILSPLIPMTQFNRIMHCLLLPGK